MRGGVISPYHFIHRSWVVFIIQVLQTTRPCNRTCYLCFPLPYIDIIRSTPTVAKNRISSMASRVATRLSTCILLYDCTLVFGNPQFYFVIFDGKGDSLVSTVHYCQSLKRKASVVVFCSQSVHMFSVCPGNSKMCVVMYKYLPILSYVCCFNIVCIHRIQVLSILIGVQCGLMLCCPYLVCVC